MDFEQVAEAVKGIPHTTRERGKILYDLVLQNEYASCLELGFACGVGSSYIAAALEKQGKGKLTSVDLPAAQARRPTAPELLSRVGLSHRTNFIFHEMGYNWFLMEALEAGWSYDFCFIDGAHTWDVDGFAFLLVDRVLQHGGTVVFDDLDWSYARSPTMRDVPAPAIMRNTPGIRKVFDVLVRTHPSYTILHEDHQWGITRKTKSEIPPRRFSEG